jgi:tetratricopeptide (TPR) repeat protein
MVITLPFVLLLLDYWPLDRTNDRANDRTTQPWSRLVLEKFPLFALSAASAIITMQAQQAGGAVRSVAEFSFGVRIANATYAYAMYLWKMLWPARLAPLYPHPGDALSTARVLLAAIVLIVITAVVWKFRQKRYLVVGWLFFLGTLVPVIGLVQVGEAAMADRYAYIPLIGLFVMIAFALDDWAQHKNLRWIPAVATAAVAIPLVLLTPRQIGYWQTNESLWSHALAVTENNFIAEDNLGGALILAGNEEEAHTHFENAARINPKDPMSHSNLGTYYGTHNRPREAVAQYEAAVGMTSDPGLLAQTYANLGATYRTLGDDERAHTNFQQSLRYNSAQFNAWLGLGLLAQKQGKLDEAILDLSRSNELHPAAETYLALGRALEQKGRPSEALAAYQEAITLAPDLIEAQQAAAALKR